MPQSPRRGRIYAPLADTGSSAIRINSPLAAIGSLASIHVDTTAGKARGDRKGTRRPADRPRHPWRGRFALRPGLYRPASPITRCQNPNFPYRISAETRAALMPPLRRATVTPVGGAFMRPWPIPAPLPYAFMCPWPILAPWPVLNREFQAIKKPRRRAA